MIVRSLQSKIGREQAWSKLASSGPSGLVRRWMAGRLLAVCDIYIPYRLYKVRVEDRRLRSTRFLAVDAASGILDPFEFAEPPGPMLCTEIETRNCIAVRLTESETHGLVLAQTRRSVFSKGFFRIVKPVISAEVVEPEFYIPYWAGFYGEDKNLKVMMLDATRGTIEGGKAANLVRTWLLEDAQKELANAAAGTQH